MTYRPAKLLEFKLAQEKLKVEQTIELSQINDICRSQINELLINNNFTYKELSVVLNVSKRTINKLCLGRNINMKTILKISTNILKINPDQLGNRTRTKYSEKLSDMVNIKIIEAYLSEQYTQIQLSKMFNVSRTKIQRIIAKYKSSNSKEKS